MIEILLKASLAIAIALLFYKLALQQESFFAINRAYLLGCLLIAFTLPNVTLPELVEQQGFLSSMFQPQPVKQENIDPSGLVDNPSAFMETSSAEMFQKEDEAFSSNSLPALPSAEIQQKPEKLSETLTTTTAEPGAITSTFSLKFWLISLYLFGVAIFSLSLLYQMGSLALKIYKTRDKIVDGDCVIINTGQKQAPCSFFHYIFIYPDDYDLETYNQIIAHEKTHVRLGHSFDLLLAELAVIVLWFNPLIWLFRKEIEKNNEYQTDAMLLEKELVRKDQYQLNLLHIAVPNKALNITTNYNQSLIKQRIMMMNSKKSNPVAYWKYSFLVPLFFGMLLLINEPAVGQDKAESVIKSKENNLTEKVEITEKKSLVQNQENEVQTSNEIILERQREVLEPLREPSGSQREINELISREPVIKRKQEITSGKSSSINITGLQNDMTKGFWYSSRENGQYCFQFKGSKERSSWNMSECFDTKEFTKKGDNLFVITRETGTLELTGNLDAEVAQGKYEFKENPSFREFLKNNNISSTNENLMIHLFFGNMSRGYVQFLKTQYADINGERLLELAIHGITQEKFKEYIALFEKYSNKKPSLQEVVAARIHNIDRAYVEEIHKMGFKDADLNKIMEARIHGVNAAYAQSLKDSGFNDLSLNQIIEARIHGIDPATIAEMRSLGFGDLSLEKIKELKIHDINSEYILSLEQAGFKDLTLTNITSARIHGVDPADIKEMQQLGFGELGIEKIIQLKIHRVDAEYVKELRSAGFEDLNLSQVLEAKIHGLTASSIKEIKNMGYENMDLRDILNAKIHGVDVAYIEDLRKAGFKDLPINKVVEAKIHGINSDFIQSARKKGYDLDSVDKYISLKIHGNAMDSLKEN